MVSQFVYSEQQYIISLYEIDTEAVDYLKRSTYLYSSCMYIEFEENSSQKELEIMHVKDFI